MIRDIIEYPAEILGFVADRAVPSEETRAILADMVETLFHAGGLGLAAPQIGMNMRAIVVHDRKTGTVYAMLNPRITSHSGIKVMHPEGCLSWPGKVATVRRSYSVRVTGQTGMGELMNAHVAGECAATFQHEIDHLDGVGIWDAPQFKKPKS